MDTPVALDGSSSRSSSAWNRSATMHTQRGSIAAVAGYSSLSIMFLSNVSAISFSACGSIHVVTNVARFSRRTAVEHQLVVDEPVGGIGVHAIRRASAATGPAPWTAARCRPVRSTGRRVRLRDMESPFVARDGRWRYGCGRGCATPTWGRAAVPGRRPTGWRRGRARTPPPRRLHRRAGRRPAARR